MSTLLTTLSIICFLFATLSVYLLYRLVGHGAALKKSHDEALQLQAGLDELEKQYLPMLEDSITGLPAWQVFEDALAVTVSGVRKAFKRGSVNPL